MTSEQLQNLRAERWRQAANPLLTLEEAAAWIDSVGLCFFLPRRQQFLTPAPSFVEACIGAPGETPARESIENASGLMLRLADGGAILPLNLFGMLSEQPDFLASREAFPYIFSLRGDRNWKSAPAGQTSPLVVEIWKLLDKDGSLTAVEIQSALGREITEAAVMRGLIELWSGLRVLPVYEGSSTTRWELIQAHFADALNAANKLSQTTALSALVSLYLDTTIAATGDEIETFLSPLTSRSRVREVVHGLTATRQLSTISMGAQTLVHIAGALPETPETEAEESVPAPPAEPRPIARRDAGKKPSTRVPRESEADDRGVQRYDSEGRPQLDRAQADLEDQRPAREERPSGERREGFAARAPFKRDRPFRKTGNDGESKPWARKTDGGQRKPFGKRPFDRSAKPFRSGPRDGEGERPPRSAEGSGDRRSGPRKPGFRDGGKFPPKRFGSSGDRPWKDRGSSDRTSSEDRPAAGGERRREGFAGGEGREKTGRPRFGSSSDRPQGARSGGKSFGRKTFGKRPGGFAGKSSRFGKDNAEAGKRPFFRKRAAESGDGERPFRRDFRDRAEGESRPAGESRPSRREGGWKPKPFGSGERFSKPRKAQGEGPSFDRPAKPRSDRPFGKGGKPAFGKARSDRPPSERSRFDKPRSDGPKSDRPKFDRPKFGKPKFGQAKSGGGSFGGKRFGGGRPGGAKSGGPRSGGSGPGGPKPGGSRPPFKKRKDRGKEDAE